MEKKTNGVAPLSKQQLEVMAGRPVNIAELGRRVGVSRQTMYDSMYRGYFRPPVAQAIARELGIKRATLRARLVGVE